MTLKNYGETHHFSGEPNRRYSYQRAAREGFPDSKTGQPRLSKEESVKRAKEFTDALLEKATPGAIGWVAAHEVEHSNKYKLKAAGKIGISMGPFVTSAALLSSAQPPVSTEVIGATLFGGLMVAYGGSIIGRRMDEKASFDAGDKNFSLFAKAIKVNPEVFKSKILSASPK